MLIQDRKEPQGKRVLGNGGLPGLLTAGRTDSASPEGGSTCHGCLCPWRLVQARWGHSPKASRAQQSTRTRAQKDHGERRVEALEHLPCALGLGDWRCTGREQTTCGCWGAVRAEEMAGSRSGGDPGPPQ